MIAAVPNLALCLGLANPLVFLQLRTVSAGTQPDRVTVDSVGRLAIDSVRSRLSVIEKKVESPPKDRWDKLAAASTLLSGVAVAMIGFYATNVYNRRQRAAEDARKERELLVAQVQTVEKFIPHLSSQGESAKSAALIAIAALGNEELAVKLARAFGGTGSTTALATIASASGTGSDAAARALTGLLEYLKPRVTTIHENVDRRASGFLATEDGLVVTTAHALHRIPPGRIQVGMLPSGLLTAAQLVAVDEQLDLALLRVHSQSELPYIALSPSAPAIGARVIAMLVDLDGSLEARVGNIIGIRTPFHLADPKATDRVVVQMSVMPGSSGAPVLDDEGRLVGIVQASDRSDPNSQSKVHLISSADVARFVEHARDVG